MINDTVMIDDHENLANLPEIENEDPDCIDENADADEN